MPRKDQQDLFIVSTPENQGSWYKSKASTLSIINSHVARVKAVPSSRNNTRASPPGQLWRISKNHRTGWESSTTSRTTPVYTNTVSEANVPDHNGLSLPQLQEVFTTTSFDSYESRTMGRDHAGDSPNPLFDDTLDTSQPINRPYLQKGLGARERLTPTSDYMARRTFKPKNYTLPQPTTMPRYLPALMDVSSQVLSLSTTARLPMHVNDGGFPFLALPVEVSTRERELLQFCRSTTWRPPP